jgi:hypothetical protein
MFGRGVSLKGKTLHSIVIVVPLHVSKFYRVLKKLTAFFNPTWTTQMSNRSIQIPGGWNMHIGKASLYLFPEIMGQHTLTQRSMIMLLDGLNSGQIGAANSSSSD